MNKILMGLCLVAFGVLIGSVWERFDGAERNGIRVSLQLRNIAEALNHVTLTNRGFEMTNHLDWWQDEQIRQEIENAKRHQ